MCHRVGGWGVGATNLRLGHVAFACELCHVCLWRLKPTVPTTAATPSVLGPSGGGGSQKLTCVAEWKGGGCWAARMMGARPGEFRGGQGIGASFFTQIALWHVHPWCEPQMWNCKWQMMCDPTVGQNGNAACSGSALKGTRLWSDPIDLATLSMLLPAQRNATHRRTRELLGHSRGERT